MWVWKQKSLLRISVTVSWNEILCQEVPDCYIVLLFSSLEQFHAKQEVVPMTLDLLEGSTGKTKQQKFSPKPHRSREGDAFPSSLTQSLMLRQYAIWHQLCRQSMKTHTSKQHCEPWPDTPSVTSALVASGLWFGIDSRALNTVSEIRST
jgi:hypothetical protein